LKATALISFPARASRRRTLPVEASHSSTSSLPPVASHLPSAVWQAENSGAFDAQRRSSRPPARPQKLTPALSTAITALPSGVKWRPMISLFSTDDFQTSFPVAASQATRCVSLTSLRMSPPEQYQSNRTAPTSAFPSGENAIAERYSKPPREWEPA